jgi:hypothetical protein
MTVPTLTVLRILAAATLLLILAGLAGHVLRRRSVARALGDPGVIRQLLGEDIGAIPWRRIVPIGLAAGLLALALLDPALAARRSGGSGPVVLLLDASGSMLVGDVGGTRIELQRAVAQAFVRAIPDLPVGIVAFAGRAFSLTPPTRDRTSVEMYLATLDPTIVTQTGSALGAAIRQGVSLLERRRRGAPSSCSATATRRTIPTPPSRRPSSPAAAESPYTSWPWVRRREARCPPSISPAAGPKDICGTRAGRSR